MSPSLVVTVYSADGEQQIPSDFNILYFEGFVKENANSFVSATWDDSYELLSIRITLPNDTYFLEV